MAEGPSGPKRLRRGHDSRLGGVASGLAEHFGADPTLVRVLFVVGLFLPGLGFGVVIAYVLMWWVIPAPEGERPPEAGGDSVDGTLMLGIVILAVGVVFLLRSSWVWTNWIGLPVFSLFWPLVLIGIGLFVIARARGRA